MEEGQNYVSVTFRTKGNPKYEKPENPEIIYEEVKTEGGSSDPVLTEEAPPRAGLSLALAGLLSVCLVSVSIIIALIFRLHAAASAHAREMITVTTQNLQLITERESSERWAEEVTRDRDRLRWTIGVILEYETFPVNKLCPQKVCRPCPDGWELFQSSCYLFFRGRYGTSWKDWSNSRDECRRNRADLVVLGSLEEQEFISNHTEKYNDDNHGYWIGFSRRRPQDTWAWVDGSNSTVTFWKTPGAGYDTSCALSVAMAPPVASWSKASCNMRNRWICESRALIKED